MALSKEEQQDLLNKLLPDSGYEVDPEPQRDAIRPTAPAERTADEDSLSRMYPARKGGDTPPTHEAKKATMRDSRSQRSKSTAKGVDNTKNRDNADNSAADSNEDDVVMIGHEDTSPSSSASSQSDAQHSSASGNHDEVYFIQVKGSDTASDGGRGPGRKIIVTTKKSVRGFQG